MAPENQADQANTNGSGSDQEQPQNQQDKQGTTPDQGGNGTQQQSGTPVRLPDDHPLVTALAEKKQKLADQAIQLQELAEARSKSAKATKLEEELAARPTPEALQTLQTRYDRLEAFAQAVGLGKALDSRTFTRDLFETDKDIAGLVKDFNKSNPSATSQALANTAGGEGTSKMDPNQLLRIAAGKA